MLAVMSTTKMLDVFYMRMISFFISPSIIDLPTNVSCLSATVKSFAFKYNGNKSHCLSLDKLANADIDPMLFDNQSWCHSINYFRVHLLSGKALSLISLALWHNTY